MEFEEGIRPNPFSSNLPEDLKKTFGDAFDTSKLPERNEEGSEVKPPKWSRVHPVLTGTIKTLAGVGLLVSAFLTLGLFPLVVAGLLLIEAGGGRGVIAGLGYVLAFPQFGALACCNILAT